MTGYGGIRRGPGGYTIDVAETAVDLHRPAGIVEPVAPERPIPRQLPSGIAGFVGRAREVQRLDDLLAHADPDGHSTAVVISAIDGTAGIGKTALAVHWAQRVGHRFPDGQLYLNLRGYGRVPFAGARAHDPQYRVSMAGHRRLCRQP